MQNFQILRKFCRSDLQGRCGETDPVGFWGGPAKYLGGGDFVGWGVNISMLCRGNFPSLPVAEADPIPY